VDKLNDILCHSEQRYVGSQLTLSYDRKRIILPRPMRVRITLYFGYCVVKTKSFLDEF
jgi:hypothetical protein